MGYTKKDIENIRQNRLGEEKINYQGHLMKIIEYKNNHDMYVEFQDEYKAKVYTAYNNFLKGSVKNPCDRVGEERYNHQGCLMKIIKYNRYRDILVEFQDEYKYIIHTTYHNFLIGQVKNPYFKSVYRVGMIGVKYPATQNGKSTKECDIWRGILRRCYDKKRKQESITYKDATCCDEWLLYENFYEWIHSQENFDKWYNGERWAVDKDILIKGNKVYSPETCCLVPVNVNNLFTKRSNYRGDLPIGVSTNGNGFKFTCSNSISDLTTSTHGYPKTYSTPEEAFIAYKQYKESIIKQVAEIEYNKGNITEKCYIAMMNYEVEITD